MTKEEVIKEYRVREILEAARRVMARYGMQGTTVDRVAEEAKVAKGTIYLYFDTKDELVHAAVLEGLREMVAETIASDDRRYRRSSESANSFWRSSESRRRTRIF